MHEIGGAADQPPAHAHALLYESVWPDHALGRPIAGTMDEVRQHVREDIIYFFDRHYVPARMIVAAAGNIDHEDFVAQVRDVFWLNQPRVSTFAQNPVQNTLSRGCSGGATYAGEVYRHSGGAVESGLPRAGYGSVPWRCAEGFHREDCAWRVPHFGGGWRAGQSCGGQRRILPVCGCCDDHAAKVFGARTIGVLLSGMGSDGVEGMAAILRSNGVAYIQDPRTCTLAGMPGAAIERGLAGRVARPREIGRMLAHDGVRA